METDLKREIGAPPNKRMRSDQTTRYAPGLAADARRYAPRGNIMLRLVRVSVLILGTLLSLSAKAECDHDRLSGAMKDYASEILSTKVNGSDKFFSLENEKLCLDYLEYIHATSLSDSNQDFRLLSAITLIRLNSKKYSSEMLNVIEADLKIHSSSNGIGTLFSTQTSGQKVRNNNTVSWLRKLDSQRAKELIEKYGK